MYHAQEVTWKTWTNDIKCLLLKSLFNEHSLNGNDSGPSHQSIRATREILNEFFPYTLGYGLVYEREKVPDSYQMHKKRCPKPEPYQDCIYWTLLARLDVEKSIRKKIGCFGIIRGKYSSKFCIRSIQHNSQQFTYEQREPKFHY